MSKGRSAPEACRFLPPGAVQNGNLDSLYHPMTCRLENDTGRQLHFKSASASLLLPESKE
jgi:hypothetical protein